MDSNNNLKRKDYIDWPNYFMGVAVLSAQRSKDPNTQVGACIANVENKIVGVGYNGFPIGCSDDEFPWGTNLLDNKYMYVVHAEVNAILNKGVADVKNCILYTTEFPCNECTKIIIQSGIKEIYYLSEKYPDRPQTIASKRMLNAVGIEYLKFEPTVKEIVIDFSNFCNKIK